jgi:hypothetical protein
MHYISKKVTLVAAIKHAYDMHMPSVPLNAEHVVCANDALLMNCPWFEKNW